MGIRAQLALLIPAILAIAMVTLAFGFAQQQRREQLDDFESAQQLVLNAVAVTSALKLAENDIAGLDTLVSSIAESRNNASLIDLAVVDETGRIIAHSQPQRFNSTMNDAFTRRALASEKHTSTISNGVLTLSAPAISGLRWGTVIASFKLESVEKQVLSTRNRLLTLAVIFAAVVAFFLATGLHFTVIRPLSRLAATVREMGRGVTGARADDHAGSIEMRELALVVNQMAAALRAERELLEAKVAERTKELEAANQQLEYISLTDPLTGTANRRAFTTAVDHEVTRAQRATHPFSILFIDADHFKTINDSLGHQKGDEVLTALALTMGQALRQSDLLARYGGEEFAVLLPETSKEEAFAVAARARTAVEQEVAKSTALGAPLTISIGVSTWPDDGKSTEAILSAADTALYEAKALGRNRVCLARKPT